MEHIGIMTAQEVKAWIDRGDEFLLIDVLSEDSYNERHLPGAKSVPAHGDDFLVRIENMTRGDRLKTIVVYCSSQECLASPTAAKNLAKAGYVAVYDYDDGLQGWEEAGYEFAA